MLNVLSINGISTLLETRMLVRCEVLHHSEEFGW